MDSLTPHFFENNFQGDLYETADFFKKSLFHVFCVSKSIGPVLPRKRKEYYVQNGDKMQSLQF